MTQQELISIVAEKIQASVESATDLMNIILSILSEELIENGIVFIDDFGVFKTQKRSEYLSLNSKTGERLLMPPAIEIVFEPFLNVSAKTDTVTANTTTYTSTDNSNADNDNIVKINYSSKVLLFEPDFSLKNSVNSAFINFEPTVLNEGVELSGIEVISDAQLTPILPENQNPIDESETESAIPEQIDLQEKVMMHHTLNAAPPSIDTAPPSLDAAPLVTDTAPPIKQSSSNNRIWMPIMGGVAITLAALFFFNGTTQKKCK
ncbi:MAG: HU family DNA-binding protein [Fermentimonas sp.]|nr:HU family DNA-binding protein [Fermentimonas sp.]